MLTYLATFRLRCAEVAAEQLLVACPSVSVRIRDFGLRHAAARAEWRLPTIAAEQGWHPGRTELVAVELVGEEDAPAYEGLRPADARVMAEGRAGRASRLALVLTSCDDEAKRLVSAASVVAGVWR